MAMKTHTIQEEKLVWNKAEGYSKEWHYVESFNDKELAEKELANLNRRWSASGTFRIVTS